MRRFIGWAVVTLLLCRAAGVEHDVTYAEDFEDKELLPATGLKDATTAALRGAATSQIAAVASVIVPWTQKSVKSQGAYSTELPTDKPNPSGDTSGTASSTPSSATPTESGRYASEPPATIMTSGANTGYGGGKENVVGTADKTSEKTKGAYSSKTATSEPKQDYSLGTAAKEIKSQAHTEPATPPEGGNTSGRIGEGNYGAEGRKTTHDTLSDSADGRVESKQPNQQPYTPWPIKETSGYPWVTADAVAAKTYGNEDYSSGVEDRVKSSSEYLSTRWPKKYTNGADYDKSVQGDRDDFVKTVWPKKYPDGVDSYSYDKMEGGKQKGTDVAMPSTQWSKKDDYEQTKPSTYYPATVWPKRASHAEASVVEKKTDTLQTTSVYETNTVPVVSGDGNETRGTKKSSEADRHGVVNQSHEERQTATAVYSGATGNVALENTRVGSQPGFEKGGKATIHTDEQELRNQRSLIGGDKEAVDSNALGDGTPKNNEDFIGEEGSASDKSSSSRDESSVYHEDSAKDEYARWDQDDCHPCEVPTQPPTLAPPYPKKDDDYEMHLPRLDDIVTSWKDIKDNVPSYAPKSPKPTPKYSSKDTDAEDGKPVHCTKIIGNPGEEDDECPLYNNPYENPTPEPTTATESPTPEPTTPEVPTPEPTTEAPTPEPTTEAPTPEPTTKSPTPEPTTKAPTPEPTTKAPTPEPTTKAPTPEPTTKAPTPEPTTKAPTPEPTTKAPTPEPTTKAPTPEPTTKAPTPEPTTEVPTPEPTTEAPTPEPTTEAPPSTPYEPTPTPTQSNNTEEPTPAPTEPEEPAATEPGGSYPEPTPAVTATDDGTYSTGAASGTTKPISSTGTGTSSTTTGTSGNTISTGTTTGTTSDTSTGNANNAGTGATGTGTGATKSDATVSDTTTSTGDAGSSDLGAGEIAGITIACAVVVAVVVGAVLFHQRSIARQREENLFAELSDTGGGGPIETDYAAM